MSLGKRFNSIKLWFVLRMYGIEGIQSNIRNGYKVALYFKQLLQQTEHFEVLFEVKLGLTCFRLKPQNFEVKNVS